MDTQFLDSLADGVQRFTDAANSHDIEEFEQAEKEYDAVLAEARSRGVTRINEGGGRIVFRGGDVVGAECVIKVEKQGAEENRTAVEETWKRMGPEAREHVASLVNWASDYRWIIQQKAGAGVPGSTQEVLADLADLGWVLADNNLENIGSIGGEPVVIDLGRLHAV